MWGEEDWGYEETGQVEMSSDYKPPQVSFGDDEEGQILQAATQAGVDMNDSQALIAFTKDFRANRS